MPRSKDDVTFVDEDGTDFDVPAGEIERDEFDGEPVFESDGDDKWISDDARDLNEFDDDGDAVDELE